MSKPKAKNETPVFATSKVGKLRDPRATQTLSLKLAFARIARVNAA